MGKNLGRNNITREIGRLTESRRRNKKRKQNNLGQEMVLTQDTGAANEQQQTEIDQNLEQEEEQLSDDLVEKGRLIDPTKNKCDFCVASYF